MQYVLCKFHKTDRRAYTYHNDGPPVKIGDVALVMDRSGENRKKVFVVDVDMAEPSYPTKPILGLHVEQTALPLDDENSPI